MQNKGLWRTVAFAFCVLVFFFALHAKTAVYNGGAPAKVTPSTSSKLWLSGNKVEVQSADLAGGAMMFWMTVVCLVQLYIDREPKAQNTFLNPPPRTFPLQQLHLFLRPPPAQN
ncbi:MAG: hypothetical protein WA655_07125 [Candidatus Korobacteraceae bacterium]